MTRSTSALACSGGLPPVVAAAAGGDWDAIAPWGCFLRENSLPGSSVERASEVPILTTFSGDGTLVVTSVEKETWPDLCGSGYRLECAGLGHTKGALAALPYARQWLEDRLVGVPLDEGTVCVIQDPVDCSIIP